MGWNPNARAAKLERPWKNGELYAQARAARALELDLRPAVEKF